jgi:hypothetical protein
MNVLQLVFAMTIRHCVSTSIALLILYEPASARSALFVATSVKKIVSCHVVFVKVLFVVSVTMQSTIF